MKKYALVSAGELLVDVQGMHLSESLLDASTFRKIQGGSPANLAANMARLGGKVALVACVGHDNLGIFIKNEIAQTGLDTQYISQDDFEPTSIVMVSKTRATPDFIAYRHADCMIRPENLPDSLLAEAAIFHTTCFALSKQPAQQTLVEAAHRTAKLGGRVSIDANFAPEIWPDRPQAWRILQAYCAHQALVKLSEDDAARLYGRSDMPEKQIISDFHDMGADLVCLTLGAKGSIVSGDQGRTYFEVAPRPIEVKDATGAGDAFWSGFLTAWNDGHDLPKCAAAALNMVSLKLSSDGPLPAQMDKNAVLYNEW
jgi:sugar/nucleoside kinase (ribokinase family)